MFRAQLSSSSGGQIVSHSIWHHHTLQAAIRCTGWERNESCARDCHL